MTTDDAASASAINRELTGLLLETGRRFGFDAVAEYPVRGGRLDVVWTWTPPSPMPGLDASVPVVGFEVESSWRTRKHVKGDLLNLTDAGVGLGVIVLAGATAQDDSLRTFAQLLVDRPGPRILIWTADDVRALAARRLEAPTAPFDAADSEVVVSAAASERASVVGAAAHVGKYAPLHRWLLNQPRTAHRLTFGQVEEVLGFPLPASCRRHTAHWHGYDGSAVARAIADAGYKAEEVSLGAETLTLVPGTA